MTFPCRNALRLLSGALTLAIVGTATAGSNVDGKFAFSKTETAKVSGNLLAIDNEYQQFVKQQSQPSAKGLAFASRDKAASISADAIVIDTAAAGDPQDLASDLRKLGAVNVVVFGRMVSCRLPLANIAGLKTLSTLQLARPAYMRTHTGW